MASTKEFLRNLRLAEADKVGMTPEQIALVEAGLEELKNVEPVPVKNPDRFDAKGMVPVDFPPGKVIAWTPDEGNGDGNED